jgi:hypothetical protein
MVFEGKVIRAYEVAQYMTEYFYSALQAWQLTKMWGLAHGAGWANETVEYVEAISILESESNKMEQEEMDKRSEEMKNKSKSKGK